MKRKLRPPVTGKRRGRDLTHHSRRSRYVTSASLDTSNDIWRLPSCWHDPLPTLYSALAICHSVGQSFREHIGQIVAITGDMNWDGEPIDGIEPGQGFGALPALAGSRLFIESNAAVLYALRVFPPAGATAR